MYGLIPIHKLYPVSIDGIPCQWTMYTVGMVSLDVDQTYSTNASTGICVTTLLASDWSAHS